MSKRQTLREFVMERLVAAADEIIAMFEQALAEQETELRLKWANTNREPKEVQHKEGVSAPEVLPEVLPEVPPEHTKAVQTQCDFSLLKSGEDLIKPSALHQVPAEENREETNREETNREETNREETNGEQCGAKEVGGSSSSDTDDSEEWETSAGKTSRDPAKNTGGQKRSSRGKRRKRRRSQNEPNLSGVVIKREREDGPDTCAQFGGITDAVSLEASAATSANISSTSWISLLAQPMQSTDPVVLMHEMLAKQDVLLQQQEQIFSLLSSSQPECALNYPDLPIRDPPGLTAIEAKLQEEDYRTKLLLLSTSLLTNTSPAESASQASAPRSLLVLRSQQTAVRSVSPRPPAEQRPPQAAAPPVREAESAPRQLGGTAEGSTQSQMHMSILNVGADFVLERCRTCCSLFHCPICPKHKPDKPSRIRTHMQTHRKNAIVFQDQSICRCKLPCRKRGHFHCPLCSKTILKREDMEVHLVLCAQRPALKQTAAHQTQPTAALSSEPTAALPSGPTAALSGPTAALSSEPIAALFSGPAAPLCHVQTAPLASEPTDVQYTVDLS